MSSGKVGDLFQGILSIVQPIADVRTSRKGEVAAQASVGHDIVRRYFSAKRPEELLLPDSIGVTYKHFAGTVPAYLPDPTQGREKTGKRIIFHAVSYALAQVEIGESVCSPNQEEPGIPVSTCYIQGGAFIKTQPIDVRGFILGVYVWTRIPGLVAGIVVCPGSNALFRG